MSVYQSVFLSKCLSTCTCLPACPPLSLSQHMWCSPSRPGSLPIGDAWGQNLEPLKSAILPSCSHMISCTGSFHENINVNIKCIMHAETNYNQLIHYPPTKSEGYSFGVVRASVRASVCPFRPSVCPSVRPSVRTFCLSGTISQYLLVRFDSFLVQMISIMDSRYPISVVKIDPLTLELLPLF